MALSRIEMKILQVLSEADEPLFNGTLAARVGLRWNSGVFASLTRKCLIECHPFKLTKAGLASLKSEQQK